MPKMSKFKYSYPAFCGIALLFLLLLVLFLYDVSVNVNVNVKDSQTTSEKSDGVGNAQPDAGGVLAYNITGSGADATVLTANTTKVDARVGANNKNSNKARNSSNNNNKAHNNKNVVWTKMPADDYEIRRNKNCGATHPFPHCCLGQGRRFDHRIEPTEALWKLVGSTEQTDDNKPPASAGGKQQQKQQHRQQQHNSYVYNLSNLTDVLNHYGNNLQRNQDLPCTIVFAGDSLSSDHAMAATCQLLGTGDYELAGCNAKLGGPAYFRDGDVMAGLNHCKTNTSANENTKPYANTNNAKTSGTRTIHPSIPHFLLKNKNNEAESCKKVLLVYLGIAHFDTNHQAFLSGVLESFLLNNNNDKHKNDNNTSTITNEGLFVFNWGVHCNTRGDGCIGEMLSDMILPLVTGPNAPTLLANWRFLFRETEPQHFNTADGNYEHSRRNTTNLPCSPIDPATIESGANNWRNREVRRFLTDHGLEDTIGTVRLYDRLVPLFQLHHPGDCTHYCYDPYRLDVTWDGLLEALL